MEKKVKPFSENYLPVHRLNSNYFTVQTKETQLGGDQENLGRNAVTFAAHADRDQLWID